MIVPQSQPSANPGGPIQDNQPKPSPALLLMAAAQMHEMGRLASPDDAQLRTNRQRGMRVMQSVDKAGHLEDLTRDDMKDAESISKAVPRNPK